MSWFFSVLFFRREQIKGQERWAKRKTEVAEVLIYRRKFSYTIFRHILQMTLTWKAEIWKQALKEVMCYSHHLEHIWLYSISFFIFNIGAPLAALFTKFHLFVTSGVILIWYSQKKVHVKQKVLRLHWPARHRRHTKQWPFTPKLYSTLACSQTTDNTYRLIFSQRVRFLIVVFGWDLELKTSESQHENMSEYTVFMTPRN